MGEWMSGCWVPKRDEAVKRMSDAWRAFNQQNNDWNTDKEIEKESINFCMVWFDLSST